MMGLGPYRPVRDLEHAVDRGDLRMAVAVAKDFAREYGRPIPIDLALRGPNRKRFWDAVVVDGVYGETFGQ
jgi:hypothetical protein